MARSGVGKADERPGGGDVAGRHLVLAGRVQGVAFRWCTRERAQQLGVAGWVRNLSDGRVEVWVEGPSARVEEMLRWLRAGPDQARVTDVRVRDAQSEGRSAFEILPTAHSPA